MRIEQTLQFIKKAHAKQKYGSKPYWTHPLDVAETGKSIFGSAFGEDGYNSALLHDVVEDTLYNLLDLTNMGFNKNVVSAVSLLTKNNKMSYRDNIDRIIKGGNRTAMMVKYADNTVNYNGDKSHMTPTRSAKLQSRYAMSLEMLGNSLGIKKSSC